MKNSGFNAKSKVSAFNNSQYQTETKVLFNPLLLIHAKRYPLHLASARSIWSISYSQSLRDCMFLECIMKIC
jgi:hypothetical protein